MFEISKKYLSVSDITEYIKLKFDSDVLFKNVLLEAEISNFVYHSSGHMYFSLKDDYSQISCVMFSRNASSINFIPQNGDKVYAKGTISIYKQGGRYQLIVNKMEKAGLGDIYQQLAKLKEKLRKEGLFSKPKKAINVFPKNLAVITSSKTAALQDIINTLNRRYPYVNVYLYEAIVQGSQAKIDVVNAIKRANKDAICDTIIIARGGGSAEDLFCFNEEAIVREIAKSKIPIITGIGHEIDYTLADYASDYRAVTPTAAAEVATSDRLELQSKLTKLVNSLHTAYKGLISSQERYVELLTKKSVLAHPEEIITKHQYILDNYKLSLDQFSPKNNYLRMSIELDNLKKLLLITYQKNITSKEQLFNNQKALLDLTSPNRLMERGFSTVYKDKKLIKSIAEVKANDKLIVQLFDGKISVTVDEVKNGRKI